jgi:hypothetical protein
LAHSVSFYDFQINSTIFNAFLPHIVQSFGPM